ncbi:hypothetical protein INR49_024443 [Caranx melampygus]|nr:hypothetical protein INR49_024443 [Caranx melampygus]
MGWRRGEVGGVDREERGEAVEGQDEEEGVAGAVGMVSLGLGLSEAGVVVVADELDEEGPALRVAGDNGLGFGVDELPEKSASGSLSYGRSNSKHTLTMHWKVCQLLRSTFTPTAHCACCDWMKWKTRRSKRDLIGCCDRRRRQLLSREQSIIERFRAVNVDVTLAIGADDVTRALQCVFVYVCVRVGVEENVNVRRERRGRSPELSAVCSWRIVGYYQWAHNFSGCVNTPGGGKVVHGLRSLSAKLRIRNSQHPPAMM